MNGVTWEVRYMGWDYFSDEAPGSPQRLLPSRVEVHSKKPSTLLTLRIDNYWFEKAIDLEKMFQPYVRQPLLKRPLEDLDQMLGNE